MCQTASSTSCSMYWREFCWKNLVRFFITPKMTTHFSPMGSACWRSCWDKGVDHHHIFWNCPKIQIFWKNIWEVIQHILGQNIPLKCTTLYLGDLPEGITGHDRYLLKILIASAKKAIIRKWLQMDVPTVDNWVEVIREIHEMERLTFLLRLQKELYTAKWTKLMIYL